MSVPRLPLGLPPDGIFSGRALLRAERVQVAILVGVTAGIVAAAAFAMVPEMLAKDFTYPWRGARAILDGANPYEAVRPTGPPPFDMHFMYPLTAAVAVLPLGFLPVEVAGVLFIAVGVAAMVYAITAQGMGRAWMLLSPPFFLSVSLAQWGPLLVAGASLPLLSWTLACKPTIGLALFAWRPSWRTAMAGAGLAAIAFAVEPGWVADWLAAARTVEGHPVPATHPLGAVALLALIKWRRPEARLVAAMSLVPQNPYFYDQLPLFLAARGGRQVLVLTALAWVAWFATEWQCGGGRSCGPEARPWVLALMFIPATVMALWPRKDDGAPRAGGANPGA
jgi:hypothetical protein